MALFIAIAVVSEPAFTFRGLSPGVAEGRIGVG